MYAIDHLTSSFHLLMASTQEFMFFGRSLHSIDATKMTSGTNERTWLHGIKSNCFEILNFDPNANSLQSLSKNYLLAIKREN